MPHIAASAHQDVHARSALWPACGRTHPLQSSAPASQQMVTPFYYQDRPPPRYDTWGAPSPAPARPAARRAAQAALAFAVCCLLALAVLRAADPRSPAAALYSRTPPSVRPMVGSVAATLTGPRRGPVMAGAAEAELLSGLRHAGLVDQGAQRLTVEVLKGAVDAWRAQNPVTPRVLKKTGTKKELMEQFTPELLRQGSHAAAAEPSGNRVARAPRSPAAARPAAARVDGADAGRPSYLTTTAFASLPLSEEMRRGVAAAGLEHCTEVQAACVPPALEGLDVVGQAKTGTGKTVAFLLPIMDRLTRSPGGGPGAIPALILTPTRELAAQIASEGDRLNRFSRLRVLTMYGGTNMRRDVDRLKEPVDILVATPGRLLDHLENTKGMARAVGTRDALEGKGPQRWPEKRLGRRLEEVAEAVGGGYCWLQMPVKPALGVRGTVAGHRLGALEGEGGYLPPLPMADRQRRPSQRRGAAARLPPRGGGLLSLGFTRQVQSSGGGGAQPPTAAPAPAGADGGAHSPRSGQGRSSEDPT